MAIVNEFPVKKGNIPLQPNDTGLAIEELQKFLNEQPEEKQKQTFSADFGRSYSLLDGNHFGKLEIDTNQALLVYQNKNKKRIIKAGQLSEIEWEAEKNKVGFATATIIREDQGKLANQVQEPELPKETALPSPAAAISIIKEPEQVATNKEATHFVKTVNFDHRLALRCSPSFVKVSKEAHEDLDKKGDLVVMMPNETLIKIIEPHVGYQCQWHQIEVVDTNPIFDAAKIIQKNNFLYAFAEFIHPLAKTAKLLPVSCLECNLNNIKKEKKIFPDWTELSLCDPFFDEEICSYFIVVPTSFTSSNQTQIDNQKKEALKIGISNLLEYYNKQRREKDIEEYLSAYRFAEDYEWFLDKRPNSTVKFLIRVLGKYFDAIPEKTDFLLDIPNGESGKLPKDWKTAHYLVSTLEDNIEKAAVIFKNYFDEIKTWTGELLDFDFLVEAQRIRDFYAVFRRFLDENEVEFDVNSDDTFEFGFSGPCFRLEYVLMSSGGVSFPLRIGFECFRKSEPVIFERTLGYIFYLEEIIRDFRKKKFSWSEFINSYSCPLVKIKPSTKIRQIPKLAREVVLSQEVVKTEQEKKKEEQKIVEPGFRIGLAQARQKVLLFVGDSLLSCDNIPKLLEQINSLEDLYAKILNKVDIKNVALAAAACLVPHFSAEVLRNMVCKTIFNQLSFEQIQKALQFLDIGSFQKVNEQLIITRKSPLPITPEAESTNFKTAVRLALSEDELYNMLTSFDSSLVNSKLELLSSLRKPGFKKESSLPLVELPDRLNTEDIMAGIANTVIETIRSLMSSILIELVKALFRSLCVQCSNNKNPPERFGTKNINDLLPKSNIGNIGDKLFDDFDIETEEKDKNFLMKSFLDDLSLLLTPSEICNLLNGTTSNNVLLLAKELLLMKYFDLHRKFNSESKIRELFVYIGSFLQSDICESILEPDKDLEELCGQDFEEELRKELLGNKLSKEQIEEQLANLKERNKKRLEQIFDLLDDKLLDNIIPPSEKGKQCIPFLNSIQNREKSLTYLNSRLNEQIYSSIVSSFNFDLLSFVQLIIKNIDDRSESYDNKDKIVKVVNAQRQDITKNIPEELKNDPLLLGKEKLEENTKMVAPFLQETLKRKDSIKKIENVSLVFPTILFNFKNPGNLEYTVPKLISNENFKFETMTVTQKVTAPITVTKSNLPLSLQKSFSLAKKCENETSTPVSVITTLLIPSDNIQLNKDDIMLFGYKNYNNSTIVLNDEFIIVNDKDNLAPFRYDNTTEVEAELKNILNKNIVIGDVKKPYRQDVFAEFICKRLRNVTDAFSTKSLSKSGEIYNYFRDFEFQKITLEYLQYVLEVTANSELFKFNNFVKLELIPDVNNPINNCPPLIKEGLLKIEEIRKIVQDRYTSLANECSPNEKKFSPIEKSNIEGMIVVLIKIYVVEHILKGIFVFSKFKIEDIGNNDFITQYISWKILKDLRINMNDVYESILKSTKQFMLARGIRFQTKEKNDIGPIEQRSIDELHPDNISGLYFIQYLIKEQIKTVFSEINDLVGKGAETVITTVSDKVLEILPVTHDINSGVNYVYTNKNKYSDGEFKLEKYVRVISVNGKSVDYIQSYSDFMGEELVGEKCGNYGIRLIYVPPIGNSEFQVLWTKHVILKTNISSNDKAWSLDLGLAHPIPLINIESEGVIENKSTNRINEEQAVSLLKQKLYDNDDFKSLFGYIFDLKKFVSFSLVYCDTVITANIPGIETVFENTKRMIRVLLHNIINPEDEDWWRSNNDEIAKMGGNEGILKDRMDNIKATGPATFLSGIAARTIPIIIKGMAERFDPAYKILKALDDAGAAAAGLTWASMLAQVRPINILGPFGLGPPIGPNGILALSFGLLPGEVKEKQKRESENILKGKEGENCEKGDKK